MQTGRSPSDAGASAPEADDRHERPLRVDGGRSATGSGTAAAGGKRTHASQQESSIRLLRRRQRATRAAVAGRVAGAVLWFTTNSNSVVQRLPSSDLCKACFFPGRGIYGAITVAQDLLANFSDQSANEQSYLPLKQFDYAGEVISFRAA